MAHIIFIYEMEQKKEGPDSRRFTHKTGSSIIETIGLTTATIIIKNVIFTR